MASKEIERYTASRRGSLAAPVTETLRGDKGCAPFSAAGALPPLRSG